MEKKELDIREKIVAGAAELFMRFGVRSVTMDEVARELGMSKKTLYQSFSNKDELVVEVSKLHIQMEREQFEEVEKSASDAIDELYRITSCLRKMMQGLNPSLLFDLQKYHPDAWQMFLNFKHDFIKTAVARNVKNGIDEGNYRKEINPEVMARMRMEQVQAVFDPKVFPSQEFDLVEVQLQVLDHFIHGLLSDQGKIKFKEYQLKQS